MTAPVATDLTRPFWEAAARKELVRPVCNDCGKNFFTPQIACPACLSENWSYESSSGLGRIYSATRVHLAASPEFAVPFRLAVVDLDEGWSILAEIVGGADDQLPAIGAQVRAAWVTRRGRTMAAFTEVGP